MDSRDYKRSLKVFDRLDIDNPRERRLSVFALNDYYGGVLREVGEEYLDFLDSHLGQGIGSQWSVAKSRIETLDNIEGSDLNKYDSAIKSVHNIRRNIAHDFKEAPPYDILEQSRDIAPDWAKWIRDVSEDYKYHQESLTAAEALVQIGHRNIEYIIDSLQDYSVKTLPDLPQNPSFNLSQQQKSLNEDALQLQQSLESISSGDKVTRELVNIISDTMVLERNKELLEREYSAWMEEVKREERERRHENTDIYMVVDEVNDDGQIFVATDNPGLDDKYITIDINHPKTPASVRESLKELEVEDRVPLRIEYNVTIDRRGHKDRHHYVAEIG